MSRIALLTMAAFTALHLLGSCLAADAATGKKSRGPTVLDKQLLNNLDSQLLNDLFNDPALGGPIPGGREAFRPPSLPGENSPPQLKQRGLGEDIQPRGGSDPLGQVMRKMRTVEDLIDDKNTSQTTQQLQQEIVDDLSALIKQAKKQCSGSKSSSRSGAKKPGAASKPAKNSAAEQNAKQTLKPKTSPSKASDALTKSEMLKEIWGHLPERVRKQMQNSSLEEFLPKYEKLIEQYYKRLAEEGTDAF